MNIAAMSSVLQTLHSSHKPEVKEGPGPDRDGDSDNSSSVQSKPATPPTGMGASVNTVA